MADKNKLLVTTGIVGVAGVLGIAFAMGAFDGSDEGSTTANPKAVSKDRLVAQSNGGTYNPCAAKCNPCAAEKRNPCNPCAAKTPCSPCGPRNPCNPCAAKNPCSPCGPCNPCAAKGSGKLSAEEAKTAYSAVLEAGNPYAGADIDGAADYRDWSRYNTAPYQSATHGGRFVNNYANAAAEAYGKFEDFGEMPVGSVLAKDSFTVDASGAASPGPLFLMRKMEGGFRPDFGNWEYTLIMPDGNVYGVTNGVGSDNVEFCGTCHLAVANQDHMFFLPDEYRTD